MCGFVGCLNDRAIGTSEKVKETIQNMNTIITHRGPDDSGYFYDEYVYFGFRRLSIIDIEAGHQPLSYENDRYWIIFNGEIYNYIELKKDLIDKGHQFSTNSDTEVILALYSVYKEETPAMLRGMFSFLIYDKDENSLFGARDPFGIKPFFYMKDGEKTYFASEKKSILLAIENDLIDHKALQHYLTFQYVPEPRTMSIGIKKLEPGHYFIKRAGEDLEIKRYWKASLSPIRIAMSDKEVIEEIQDVLYDSVDMHMRSDVPVGCFLSGGIDSSIIASIASEINPEIKTFSVGFEHEGFSEIDVAKETASKLLVENISYIITPEEYMKELPKIVWHMDDPLADPAAIPLYFVAREARKHVTVVLSGEGADELFGGYNIYREPSSLKFFDNVPKAAKSILNKMIRIVPEGIKGKNFIERGCTPLEERYIGNAKMFSEAEKEKLYKWYDPNLTFDTITKPIYEQITEYDLVNKMQYVDIHTWLRGDILLKADKMTMAHSLELRVPFLDKEVFEVASKITVDQKIAHNTTKYILRKAAEGIVPDHVINRKKLGFPVPIRLWLKNEMYDWAIQIIKESDTEHLFNKELIIQILNDHCTGKGDYSRKIWTVLIFMIWYQVFIENKYGFQNLDKNQLNTTASS